MPDVVNSPRSGAGGILFDHANSIYLKVPIYSLTRVATTATAKAYSHGLSTGTLNVIGAKDANYNVSATTLTVTDADTLTYTVGGSPVSPDPLTSAGAYITDPSQSNVVQGVVAVQFGQPPAGTTIQIWKKIHPSAGWVQEGADITSATAAAIIVYSAPMIIRCLRTAGAGNAFVSWLKQT